MIRRRSRILNRLARGAEHSSLGTTTSIGTKVSRSSRPPFVHAGRHVDLGKARQRTLDLAYAAHPERFVKGPPTPPRPQQPCRKKSGSIGLPSNRSLSALPPRPRGGPKPFRGVEGVQGKRGLVSPWSRREQLRITRWSSIAAKLTAAPESECLHHEAARLILIDTFRFAHALCDPSQNGMFWLNPHPQTNTGFSCGSMRKGPSRSSRT